HVVLVLTSIFPGARCELRHNIYFLFLKEQHNLIVDCRALALFNFKEFLQNFKSWIVSPLKKLFG
ncbi:hypothetical protein, partial [Brasilonema bromeliae]|uniref:hypothetical protein n=1 Tax=Brasilonema bromeliae TaxID=383615 RepID=UPI001B7CDC6F